MDKANEILLRMAQSNRERQKRFYDKNRQRILQERKDGRRYIREEKQRQINNNNNNDNNNNDDNDFNDYNNDEPEIMPPTNNEVVIQPTIPPVEPVPAANKPTKVLKIIYNIQWITEEINKLDITDKKKKQYIDWSSTLHRILKFKNINTQLANFKATKEKIDNSRRIDGEPYLLNSRKISL